MIFRLSQKLNAKIKAGTGLENMPVGGATKRRAGAEKEADLEELFGRIELE